MTGYADGVTPPSAAVDGQVYFQTITRSGAVITPWSRLGGPVLGSPAASWSRTGSVLDVFAVGLDRRVYRRQYLRGVGWKPGWIVVPGVGRSDRRRVGRAPAERQHEGVRSQLGRRGRRS